MTMQYNFGVTVTRRYPSTTDGHNAVEYETEVYGKGDNGNPLNVRGEEVRSLEVIAKNYLMEHPEKRRVDVEKKEKCIKIKPDKK